MTADQRAEFQRIFRNSEAGLSYQAALIGLSVEHPNVKRIFEWGPGASTMLLLTLFPEAEIYGVEHDARWMEHCKKLMEAEPRVHITHERIDTPQKNGCYVTAPMYHEEKFDLIFVDGRLRRDCLAVASRCASPQGAVVLHDAKRGSYHPAFKFYHPTEIRDNTAILRPLW